MALPDFERRVLDSQDFLNHYFERRGGLYYTIEADTPFLKECFYRLRADAFVKDDFKHKGSGKNLFDQRCEMDEYDNNSIHFLTVFRPYDIFIGGTRLILPSFNKYKKLTLPSAEVSEPLRNFVGSVGIENCMELSRFILSQGRMKIVESYDASPEEKACSAYAPTILYLLQKIYKTANERNGKYVLTSLDAYLIRILTKMGIKFIPVGQAVPELGNLHPCYVDVENNLKSLKTENMKLYNFLTEN